jgi:hypothetical protein
MYIFIIMEGGSLAMSAGATTILGQLDRPLLA